MRTHFYLIRHGESEDNAAHILQGHRDTGLTPLGVTQALALAKRLQERPCHQFYTSDLARAEATATILADQNGHTPVRDQRLRERHYGILQGLTRADVETRFPHLLAALRAQDPDFVVPGGESYWQLASRAYACLHDIRARHPGQHIVIVTHGGVLDAYLRKVLGIPLDQPRRTQIPNACWNYISHNGDGWLLHVWGDISHIRIPPAHTGRGEVN